MGRFWIAFLFVSGIWTQDVSSILINGETLSPGDTYSVDFEENHLVSLSYNPGDDTFFYGLEKPNRGEVYRFLKKQYEAVVQEQKNLLETKNCRARKVSVEGSRTACVRLYELQWTPIKLESLCPLQLSGLWENFDPERPLELEFPRATFSKALFDVGMLSFMPPPPLQSSPIKKIEVRPLNNHPFPLCLTGTVNFSGGAWSFAISGCRKILLEF